MSNSNNNYVVLKTAGGCYAVLVKNKKYGDGGKSSYTTDPGMVGVSTFPDPEKANACIAAIKKRRPHPYDFVVMTIDEATKALLNNTGFCIGKRDQQHGILYLLEDNTFGEVTNNKVRLFSTEIAAEATKINILKFLPADTRLLVLNYILPD